MSLYVLILMTITSNKYILAILVAKYVTYYNNFFTLEDYK